MIFGRLTLTAFVLVDGAPPMRRAIPLPDIPAALPKCAAHMVHCHSLC